MPIDSHLPQADPFSLVPTFKSPSGLSILYLHTCWALVLVFTVLEYFIIWKFSAAFFFQQMPSSYLAVLIRKPVQARTKGILDKPVFCITWRFLLCMKELIEGGSGRLYAFGSCVDRVKGTWQWDRFFDLFGKDLWQVLKPLRFWLRITEMLVIENRLPASAKAGSREDCLE